MVSRESENRMPPDGVYKMIMDNPVPEELLKMYEQKIRNAVAYNDSEAEAWRKTAKFVSVKVDGGRAVAVVEYDGRDPATGAAQHKRSTTYLRRENGVWLMYKCVR